MDEREQGATETPVVCNLADCKGQGPVCTRVKKTSFLSIHSKKTEDASVCHKNSRPGSSSHNPEPPCQRLPFGPYARPALSPQVSSLMVKDSAGPHRPGPCVESPCPNVNFYASEDEAWVLSSPEGSWEYYSYKSPPSETSKGEATFVKPQNNTIPYSQENVNFLALQVL